MDLLLLWLFVGSIFMCCANFYAWHKLIDKKIDFKNYKNYIALIILICIGTIFNYALATYLKLPLMILVSIIMNYFVIAKNLEKSITSVIVTTVINMFAELLMALIASLFIGEYSELFMTTPVGICLLNFVVAVIIIVFSRLKRVRKIYNWLLSLFNDMKRNKLLLCVLATVMIILVFMVMSYISLPPAIVLFVNSSLVIIYVLVIIRLFITQEKFNKISNKYEISLNSLKDVENLIDNYRVNNHENKNQLLTIRNMVKAKDKKTINYIDTLLDSKQNDDQTVYYKTAKIPEGGLRATIYSKIMEMESLGIHYILDISNDVSTVDLIKLEDNVVLNSCKIIGVFLDNAIDAVKKISKKEIVIELFVMDKYFYVDISNTYSGNIDFGKINNKGYTTKGKGHGYGLALVNKIINSVDSLEYETKINKQFFTQRLKIKM